MRIRNFRPVDVFALVEIDEQAAAIDGTCARDLEAWLAEHQEEAMHNVFVITDDDDELNTWGQAGTLEGIEGEIVGFTILHLRVDERAYHFVCEGAVQPAYRRQGAGRALLISALNWAHIWSADYEFDAEQEGRALYFEALLPDNDTNSPGLASACELEATDDAVEEGMRLYRRGL